jgi:predicted MPP superfamily phosphohydrolase
MPWRILATPGAQSAAMVALACYLVVCWVAATVVGVIHLWRTAVYDVSTVLRYHRRRSLSTRNVLHSPDHPHHALVHLPGNESLDLDLTERGLDVPRLPPALDGLSIMHISDLHFTGKVGKPFFEEAMRMSNALEPDLVAVTGDIVDKNRYIDWIPDTLGRLKARYGVYYIFGNHELRVDWKRVHRVLGSCGLIYVGGRWLTVEVRGQPLLLAGNELPWFKPAADPRTFPPRSEVPFRLMLAHSPDQIEWGRQCDGDLMLAGHTHGGQVRLPFLGPLFAPSNRGVQYASGLFHIPPTILNVSRGLSGEIPLRMNCPPEIIHLTLHASGAPDGAELRAQELAATKHDTRASM